MPRCEKCNAEWTLSNTLEQECPVCGATYDPGSLSEIEDFLLDDNAELTFDLREVRGEEDDPATRQPSPTIDLSDAGRGGSPGDADSDPDFTMVFGGKFDEDLSDEDDDLDPIALGESSDWSTDNEPSEGESHTGDTTLRPEAATDLPEVTQRVSDPPSLADDPHQGRTLPEMTRLVGDTDPGLRSPATPAGDPEAAEPIEHTQAIGDSSNDEGLSSWADLTPAGGSDVTQMVGDGSSRKGDSSEDATNPPLHASRPDVTQNLSGESSQRPEVTMPVGQGSDSAPSSSRSGSSSQDADTLVPDSATMKRGTDRPSSLVQTPRSRDITGLGSGQTNPTGVLGERPSVSLKAGDTHVVQHESIRLRAFRLSKDEAASPSDDSDYSRTGGPFKGGMGYVYKMRQTSLDRNVAVKQVKPDMAGNESDRNKLITEGVITARLEHPNIVPVHDLGIASDGQPFYVMKFVEGQEWEKLIGKYSEQENLEVLLKVCQAVAFAHSHEVINRDLKPGNVMIGAFGEVLVMDWGLAARVDREAEIPPGGTPLYMPPETALEYLDSIKHKTVNLSESPSRTRRVKAGKYCDIYLLGALLFKIVTGKPPHTGKNTFDCLKNAARNRLVKVDRASELLDISYKAMATEPEDRYPTVGAFIDAIKAYQEHAQSLLITRRASEDFELAENKKSDASAKSTDTYALFSSAEHGFKNALELWPENHKAQRQLDKTLHAFAETAFRNGDFDLALSMLDERSKDDEELRVDVLKSKEKRASRDRWYKTLQQVAASLLVVSLVFIGWTIVARQDAMTQTKIAEEMTDKAAAQAKIAAEAKTLADSAKEEAIAERDKARIASDEAKLAASEAESAKEDARRAKTEATTALAAADAAKSQAAMAVAEANAAKGEAEQAKVIAATEKQKATEASAAAELQEHFARVASIEATLIKDGAYPAWLMLQEAAGLANPDADKFDWQVLAKRCNWVDEGYALPIDPESQPVVAASGNGARLAMASTIEVDRHVLSMKSMSGLAKPDGSMDVLPLDQFEVLSTLELPARPQSLAVSEDGRVAAVVTQRAGSADGKLLLYNVETGEPIEVSAQPARHVAFGTSASRNASAGYYLLVGAGSDLVEYRVDSKAESAERLLTVDGSFHLADIAAVAYSEDGLLAASADSDGKIAVWRTVDRDRFVAEAPPAGQPRQEASAAPWTFSHSNVLSTSPRITAMAFAPSSVGGAPALAYGCDDGNVFVLQGPWRATEDGRAGEKGGSLVEYISELPAQLAGSHTGPVSDLLVTRRKVRVGEKGESAADRYLVVSTGVDGRALVRDSRLEMQEATPAYVKVERRYHDAPIVRLAEVADGAIVTSDTSGRVVRWLVDVPPDAAGLIAGDGGPVGPVTSIRYDATRNELVVGDAAGMTRVWSLGEQQLPETYFVGHQQHSGMQAWLTGDRRQIATVADDHRLCLWDAQTGLIERVLPLEGRAVVAPTADRLGLLAATDRRDTAAQFVSLTGGRAPLWDNRPRVSAVQDLGGTGAIAVGLRDGQVYLWDRTRGRTELVSATVRPHWRPVVGFASDPKAGLLYSADRSGRIARWDLKQEGRRRPLMVVLRSDLRPDGLDDEKITASELTLDRISLSRDGDRLLAVVSDDTTSWPQLLDAITLEPLGDLPPLGQAVADACFSGSDHAVLALDRSSRAWEVRPGDRTWLPASSGALASADRVTLDEAGEPIFAGPGGVVRGLGASTPIVQSRSPVALVNGTGEGVVVFDAAGHVTRWIDQQPQQTAVVDSGRLTCCPLVSEEVAGASFPVIVRTDRPNQPLASLELWDAASGLRIAALGETPGGTCTAMTSSAGMVAMAIDTPAGPTIVLRLPDGKLSPVFTLPALDGVVTSLTDLAISPDGRQMLAVDDTGVARLLTLGPTGWNALPLEGDDYAAACFSPDGSRLVLGGQNGQLFMAVAEAQDGIVKLRTVLSLGGHSAPITFLGFAERDGQAMLLSGDAAGKAMAHVSG